MFKLLSLFIFSSLIFPFNERISCVEYQYFYEHTQTTCEKIDLTYKYPTLQYDCLSDFYHLMDSLTGHSPKLNCGYDGIYYEDTAQRENDFRIWRDSCGCE